MTAKHIQEAWDKLRAERDELAAMLWTEQEALKFYADGDHFMIADEDAWDTVSGEPPNLWCDEAGTATVEDGSIAKHALALPNTAADILRQRDARTLREAADIADQWGDARTDGQGGHALRNYAARIRNMAAELERKNA